MKKKLFIAKIKDKYYEQNIWVIVGEKELFKKYVSRKYKMPDLSWIDEKGRDGDAKTITLQHGEAVHTIVWIVTFKWKVFEMGLLVHELLHVVTKTLKDIGFKFSEDSEEAYTYYLQTLTQDVFWKLRKVR